MKQKFFNAAVVLVILVLSFGLSNQAGAQTTENGTIAPGVKDITQPAYMQEPTGENMKKGLTTNGNPMLVDQKGNVTLITTVDGVTQTTIVSKPVINLNIEAGSDVTSYIENYTLWLKANANFSQYVTAEELDFLNSGNLEGLYRANHLIAEHMAVTNQ